MGRYFGSEIDDAGPERFLRSRGYTLTRGWEWRKPVPAHTVSEEEWNCITFLADEWDFGGIAKSHAPQSDDRQ